MREDEGCPGHVEEYEVQAGAVGGDGGDEKEGEHWEGEYGVHHY